MTETRSRSVGIVGGGMMGVALAHDFAKAGYAVTLYEGADRLGGLATWEDFGPFTWDRFYHCILPGDQDLLDFLEEIGLGDEVTWSTTRTGVYIDGRTYPLNSAFDFVRFSALSLWERARLAFTMLRCAAIRNVRSLEDVSARDWFIRVGGEGPFRRIWAPLLRAKFGDAMDRVSPVFLAAKIQRMVLARKEVARPGNLAYVAGGYHRVWTRCAERLAELGVDLRLSSSIRSVEPDGEGGVVVDAGGESHRHARAILTTPFRLARRLTEKWPGGSPVPEQASVDYMGLVCLILALRRKVVPDYVLNIADDGFPFTGVIGMMDLISSDEVNGLELVYVPKYIVAGDPIFEASDEEIYESFFPALQRIFPELLAADLDSWFVRRARIVQPIQVLGYSRNVPSPDFEGPVSVVNNSQLLETDLHNSMVILHAREAVRAVIQADERAAWR